jgi:hypothetical protein
MKCRAFFCGALAIVFSAVCASTVLAQQTSSAPGVPAHMVVTVEARHGANPPALNQDDIMVNEGKERDKVTDWIPLTGDHAGLEFFVLIDDALSVSLGSQLDDIRQFITAQPATTKIGVAYMQNGVAQVVQNLTTDHAAAAKALRLPLGVLTANGSPYFSLSDLIKRWPDTNERREVFMVSDGIDPMYDGPDDPYVDAAIDDAQRAGIVVFDIYTTGAGHFGHSYWRTYWGQIYLSQVAEMTGGESYYIGFNGPPVAFAPYLDQLASRLTRQYLLGFLAKPEKKGGFHHVRITTEVPNVDLVAADRVWVPAGL